MFTEDQRRELDYHLSNVLQGVTYTCSRVWEAWDYGTMTQDDFMPAEQDAELVGSLVDTVEEMGYVKLRRIEDLEELEALPEFSLIKFGDRFGRVQMHTIAVLDSGDVVSDKSQALPCLVLREGK